MHCLALLLVHAHAVQAHFNEAHDVVIGDQSPPAGAITLNDDYSTSVLDLNSACGTALCPSILMFTQKQWGTINVMNCKGGRTYTFINKSSVDLGIIIQQNGGMFGSKAISRFDLVNCFCSSHKDEESHELSNILLCR